MTDSLSFWAHGLTRPASSHPVRPFGHTPPPEEFFGLVQKKQTHARTKPNEHTETLLISLDPIHFGESLS